jgi:hypothetical protein
MQRLRQRRGEDERGRPVESRESNYVDLVVKRVEQFLGDVIENPESPEAAEECWTLCIDSAHEIGLENDSAILVAKAACARLGYPRDQSPLESMKKVQEGTLICKECSDEVAEGEALNGYCPKCVDAFERRERQEKEKKMKEKKPTKENFDPPGSQAVNSFEYMGHYVEVHHNTGEDGGENNFIAFIDGTPEDQTVSDTIEQCAGNARAVCHQLSPPSQQPIARPPVRTQAAPPTRTPAMVGANSYESKVQTQAQELVNKVLSDHRLTPNERSHMSKTTFVFQKDRRYPIPDKSHARNALARVSQHGTPAERSKVRGAVHRKFPTIGQQHD